MLVLFGRVCIIPISRSSSTRHPFCMVSTWSWMTGSLSILLLSMLWRGSICTQRYYRSWNYVIILQARFLHFINMQVQTFIYFTKQRQKRNNGDHLIVQCSGSQKHCIVLLFLRYRVFIPVIPSLLIGFPWQPVQDLHWHHGLLWNPHQGMLECQQSRWTESSRELWRYNYS